MFLLKRIRKKIQNHLHTFFKPMRTNAAVHQLNVLPNHARAVPGNKSANRYSTPTTKTAQLNQQGHDPHPLPLFILNVATAAFLFLAIQSPLCDLPIRKIIIYKSL